MKVWHFIVLSLVLHLLLWRGGDLIPHEAFRTRDAIEVQVIPPPPDSTPKERKEIVSNADLNEKLEDVKDKVKRLSAKTIRVAQEMKAQNFGMTQNRNGSTPQPKLQALPITRNQQSGSANSDRSVAHEAKENDANSEVREAIKNAVRQQHALNSSVSTISSDVQNVSIGNMTALNTDRYTFYSFYQRIEELIRPRWEQKAQAALERWSAMRGKTTQWTTEVEIWIQPNGEFHSAHILRESGFNLMDTAATSPFKEARFFPNPPPEMVQDDHFIRINYRFIVYYHSQAKAQND